MRSLIAWECAPASERAAPPPDRPGLRVIAGLVAAWLAGAPLPAGAAGGGLGAAGAADSLVSAPAARDSGAAAGRAGRAAGAGAALDSLIRHARLALVPDATLVPNGAASGELEEPAGIAVDAFGRLFVADAALHRLDRYDKS